MGFINYKLKKKQVQIKKILKQSLKILHMQLQSNFSYFSYGKLLWSNFSYFNLVIYNMLWLLSKAVYIIMQGLEFPIQVHSGHLDAHNLLMEYFTQHYGIKLLY